MRTILLAALTGLLLASAPVQAQDFPSKPVRLIVPIAAGGATDVVARAVGERLAAAWGQPVVVENRPSASNQLGADYVAKAAPDGYTLLASGGGFVAGAYLAAKPLFDPVKDFLPVAGLGVIHQALVVHPSVPIHGVGDLMALAKQKPGELNYGTYGIGSPAHVNMAVVESMAGVKVTPVHYRGGGLALTDLLGGHIHMLLINVGLMTQPWQAGQLRPIGVGSSKRLAAFPELPAIGETLPGFEAVVWFGIFAPPGTPHAIVTRINEGVQRIVGNRSFREQFLDPNFYEALSGSPEQFASLYRADAAKFSKVIKDLNLKAD
jgi:tripartite-type tricarboxylate transporter receptor subunit TctC